MTILHRGDPTPVGEGYRARGLETSELEEFLLHKEAVDTTPETSTKTDEDKSTVGMTNLYDEPEDRKKDESEAPWGESDLKPGEESAGHADPHHHTTAAEEGSDDVRRDTLGRLFDGKGNADQVHQQTMAENLQHVAKGDFESRSVHLHGKMRVKTSSVVDEPTLGMRVKDLLGRF